MSTNRTSNVDHAISEVGAWENREYTKQIQAQANPIDEVAMVQGYLKCALWASIDENDRPLDMDYLLTDFTEEAQRAAKETCKDFIDQAMQADIVIGKLYPSNSSGIGHDLWLTRNHHGAGFWDRGFGAAGESLTKIAHALGSSDAMANDDGKVSLS
jgi:hypothetical protein